VNLVTRRMVCIDCSKLFDVTPMPSGAWHITLAEPGAVPFIVSSIVPVCVIPECQHALIDSGVDTASTEDGAKVRICKSKNPVLN